MGLWEKRSRTEIGADGHTRSGQGAVCGESWGFLPGPALSQPLGDPDRTLSTQVSSWV